MNLISCTSCAAVLDKDKFSEPPDLHSKESGLVNEDYYEWNGETYVPWVACPVCHASIRLE